MPPNSFARRVRVAAPLVALLAAGSAAPLCAGLLEQALNSASEFQLGNGVRVIVAERPGTATGSFAVRLEAGYFDCEPGKDQIASLAAALYWNGSVNFGSRSAAAEQKQMLAAEEQKVQWVGAREDESAKGYLNRTKAEGEYRKAVRQLADLGEAGFSRKLLTRHGGAALNSTAAGDHMTWTATLPANRAEVWFKLNGDWIAHPTTRDFHSESLRVWRQRHAEDRSGTFSGLANELLRQAFPGTGYVRAGFSREFDAGDVRQGDVRKFYEQHWSPDRVTIAVAGPYTTSQVRQWAERYFASIPRRPAPPRQRPESAAPRAILGATLENTSAVVMAVAWPRPPLEHADAPAFEILTSILSGTGASGLATRFPEGVARGSVQLVTALPSPKLPSLYTVFAAPRGGLAGVNRILNEIQQGISLIVSTPPAPEEIAAARLRANGSLLASLATNSGTADLLARLVAEAGSLEAAKAAAKRSDAVTGEDLARVARTYLSESNRWMITNIRDTAPTP